MPNDEIRISFLQMEDIPAVAQIEKQCFSVPWSEASFRDTLKNPNALYLVAKREGVVAGYVGLYCIFEEAVINQVAVREEFRRNQIASMLLERMFEELEKKNVKSVTLEVRKSNQAAIALYESKGFVSEGIRPGFYEKPAEDAIIMWKR